jgi:hypothetical protein
MLKKRVILLRVGIDSDDTENLTGFAEGKISEREK